MLSRFFAQAAVSPGRQLAFRQAVITHVVVLSAGAAALQCYGRADSSHLFGQLLLISGIVEGAILIGWRLTQLPKSQALEFLLVSPLTPLRLFWSEALVGASRLALVTLAGLPVLLLLTFTHSPGSLTCGPLLDHLDLLPLLIMPLTWGLITGLGLTAWAYEPLAVRRWAERVLLGLIVLYLAIGLAAGENLRSWVAYLPRDAGRWFLESFKAFHVYNPFAVMESWFVAAHGLDGTPWIPWEKTLGLELGALAVLGAVTARGASRLKGHFHERHYRPVVDRSRGRRRRVGDWPLSWWAVRRVTEYSGRVNVWLACGVGVLYALYTVAGSHWPAWLGRQAFVIFDRLGGVPGLVTALVVLAAVPAAFQYGLWDSNAQERCRRLELLLLTRLEAGDYWRAATAAAWRRGRGYFAVGLLLLVAAGWAGQTGVVPLTAALAAGVILWGCYFAVGFRAFSRGVRANGWGLLLTIGLPILTYLLYGIGGLSAAALLPPGSVYGPAAGASPLAWLPGPLLGAVTTLLLARSARAQCDRELRRWYELHHGRQVLE